MSWNVETVVGPYSCGHERTCGAEDCRSCYPGGYTVKTCSACDKVEDDCRCVWCDECDHEVSECECPEMCRGGCDQTVAECDCAALRADHERDLRKDGPI